MDALGKPLRLCQKNLVGVISYTGRQRATAVKNIVSASYIPNLHYVYALILSLLLTACQGTSRERDEAGSRDVEQAAPRVLQAAPKVAIVQALPTVAKGAPKVVQAAPSVIRARAGLLQARRVEFTSPATYRLAEETSIIDFREVYLGANVISVPVTWEIANKPDTIKGIKFRGGRAKPFAAQLIRNSNKKIVFSHVFFVFSPSKVGWFEAFVKPSLIGDVRAEGIMLRGMGVAVLNQGNLMSYDIPDALKKGLDFGRIPAGTSGQRTFQLKNLDLLHEVDVSDVIVSSDFEVKTVKLSDSVVHQGPVRSFNIPKGQTAEVTIEFRPPAGFRDNEKMFTGSLEFRSNTGTSRTGVALCGMAFHPPHVGSGNACYE
jgi:hypothetical protein